MKADKIEGFFGPYYFLNNFYRASVWHEGVKYPTCEHAYQACKSESRDYRETVSRLSTPWEAKVFGRSVILPHDWSVKRLSVMRSVVESKFTNPILRCLLVETGEAELVNSNDNNDAFFGVCRDRGENWLGRILMEVRDAVRISTLEDDVSFKKPRHGDGVL